MGRNLPVAPDQSRAEVIETTRANPPQTNLAGLRQYWRSDLVAGFSVALVALPLALGIATAGGAPPISGLISAIVAGLLTTFLRGSHVAINGPGNALIVIVAAGFTAFGGENAFRHVLGAMIVAGAIQMLFGLLRLGKLGDLIPAAVVQGMLAAIGLIIVGKQSHVLFGGSSNAKSAIDVFLELPQAIASAHPAATAIGLVSLVILVVHPHVKVPGVHYIPAPLWVIGFAIPAAFLFEHFESVFSERFNLNFTLAANELVEIPEDLLGSVVTPSFERIGEPAFWLVVITVTLVCSIENLVSVKAVDKLDSHRRTSKLDRDLVAMGATTILSAGLGGLPVLTVVARSSVNVNHGANTGWSNFFHGALLLAFVLFLGPVIEEISLSALAGILVYTGYKLTAPSVLADAVRKGPEHVLVFAVTVFATLEWGLLVGIGVGMAAEFLGHLLILGLPPREVWLRWGETRVETTTRPNEPRLLRFEGLANFLTIPRLRRALAEVVDGERIVLDFSAAIIVDRTLLEYCHENRRRHERAGGSFEIVGLERHRALSDHPDALHSQDRRSLSPQLTARQHKIANRAKERAWTFDPRRAWEPDHLDDFHFFRVHPIQYRDTLVHGSHEVGDTTIEFWHADVTFDEGALIPEIYHTTALVLKLPRELPELVLEQEGFIERALEIAIPDIDFEEFPKFTRKFTLRGPDEDAIREFMSPELLRFFEREDAYHIESTGHELVIFKTFMRISTAREIEDMLAFSERLSELLVEKADG